MNLFSFLLMDGAGFDQHLVFVGRIRGRRDAGAGRRLPRRRRRRPVPRNLPCL